MRDRLEGAQAALRRGMLAAAEGEAGIQPQHDPAMGDRVRKWVGRTRKRRPIGASGKLSTCGQPAFGLDRPDLQGRRLDARTAAASASAPVSSSSPSRLAHALDTPGIRGSSRK
jgi:hypothetical protein